MTDKPMKEVSFNQLEEEYIIRMKEDLKEMLSKCQNNLSYIDTEYDDLIYKLEYSVSLTKKIIAINAT